ncbi:MAG: thymidylate synthase [Defluviitaleaceae bacterium]|nr:thymidylate synthase [Defluviitaleaceae bacterium]
MAYADKVFIENCKDILENGSWDTGQNVRTVWEDGTKAHTIKQFGIVNRYDLSKEFPALTLRRLFFKNCIDEMLWIWQKKSNRVSELKSRIWDAWADEGGTIGKAYGYQLGIKHRYADGDYDQVDRLLLDLKNNPASRRMITSIYNHDDLHAMSLYPCAYSMTYNVKDGVLNGILNQRSADFLTANNWNVCGYAILLHMFAQASGLVAGELVHVISDAHIYDRHVNIVKELIQKEPRPAPRLIINPDIKNFYDFKVEDFALEDYKPHPFKQTIPVAI